MIGLLRDIFNIADRYGLKILNIDTIINIMFLFGLKSSGRDGDGIGL